MQTEVLREIGKSIREVKNKDVYESYNERQALEKMRREAEDFLFRSASELYTGSEEQNPETLKEVWQTLWDVWGARVGVDVTVPPLATTEEVNELVNQEGGIIVYVPPEIVERRDLVREISAVNTRGVFDIGNPNRATNDIYIQTGWLYMSTLGVTGDEEMSYRKILAKCEERDLTPANLTTYTIALSASRELTHQLIDKGTSASLLLGSRETRSYWFEPDGYPVYVWEHEGYFGHDRSLEIDSFQSPEDRFRKLREQAPYRSPASMPGYLNVRVIKELS